MMDILSVLLKNLGQKPHTCQRCKQSSGCAQVTWMCPHCNTYSSDASLPRNQASSSLMSAPLVKRHVANTRDVLGFVVLSDKSLGSGVRRITALTGTAAQMAIQKGIELRSTLQNMDASGNFEQQIAELEKELKSNTIPMLLRGELYVSIKQLKKVSSYRRRKREAAKGSV